MVATFCLRLACGLIAAMLILPEKETPPRFFRVQYLIAVGLLTAAGFFLASGANLLQGALVGAAIAVSIAGSVIWHVDRAPLARTILVLAVAGVGSAMLTAPRTLIEERTLNEEAGFSALALADDLTSAALLGSCTSAMLMGHSYLIAPSMSLTPLLRLLGAMAISLMVRVIVTGLGMSELTEMSLAADLNNETLLLLSLRWGLGFVGVLAMGWMAWESARIRSTQSATGILYVAVVFCFVGELCGQLGQMKRDSTIPSRNAS
jgi:hypothetical protein